MAEQWIFLRAGNLLPAFHATASRGDGGALGFAAADVSEVRLIVTLDGADEPAVDAATEWTIDPEGTTITVDYDWKAEETDVGGSYEIEIRAVLTDGRAISFPNREQDALRLAIWDPAGGTAGGGA